MLSVIGVHPVQGATEPVYLIEVAVSGSFEAVDWGSVTQAEPGQPHSDWQVAYDERSLGVLPDGRSHAVFFFHYLQLDQPLTSAHGSHPLVPVSEVPPHLMSIRYEPPG